MRNKIPLILALLIGIVVMMFSYNLMQKQVEEATTTVAILVPKSDIEAYSIVTAENLTTLQVPPSIVDANTVVEFGDITDKVCTVPLYTNKPIDIRNIADKPSEIGNKQVVGVYIDAARCAGVVDGDLVDVYRVNPGTQGEAAPLIAQNARVIRVTDEKGVPVKGASAVLQSAETAISVVKNPRIVYLLVTPNEVPQVIQGSLADTNNLALSKKGQETEVVVIQEVNKGAR